MTKNSRYLMPFLFFLIPISYSVDNDPYRSWEVLFWSAITLFVALTSSARICFKPEFAVILIYTLILTFQQFVIPDGRFWFGAQYALVFAAAFVPSLVISWLSWSIEDFNRFWDAAIKTLSFVVIVNIFGSRLFGWGEFYEGGLLIGRYFGFLGDGISPVIVFPLIYFLIERRYVWAILLFFSMIMTAGKAAALLLFLSPLPMLVVRMRPAMQFLSICSILILAFNIESIIDNLFYTITSSQFLSYSFNTRVLSYQVGIDYFKSSPIWGVGINQSMLAIDRDAEGLAQSLLLDEFWQVEQIHNAFIRALAETGIVGFGVLAGLCVLLIRRALGALRMASNSAPSRCRSIVLSGGIWTVLFIVTYQSTGWFEHGHPQFAWLLIIGALTGAGARLLAPSQRLTGYDNSIHSHVRRALLKQE